MRSKTVREQDQSPMSLGSSSTLIKDSAIAKAQAARIAGLSKSPTERMREAGLNVKTPLGSTI